MPDSEESRYEHDLVFTSEGSEDFKNVHIELEIKEHGFLLTLTTDESIDKHDMQKILLTLQEDKLNRMRVRLVEDCTVLLYADGDKYQVVTEGPDAKVKEFILLER